MKQKIFRSSLLSIVLVLSVVAQQPAMQSGASTERLRQYINFLASDALEGRRTGSAGANDAAHYIAGEFSQMGLRPAFKTIPNPRNRGEARSNYRQRFPYVGGLKVGPGCELSIAGKKLVVGEEWLPVGISTNATLDNMPSIFVGYGITATALKYDDYEKAETSGKIAIAFSGSPDSENPHDHFARYKDERWKAIAAKNAGAKALVLIVQAEKFQDAHLSRLHFDNTAGDAGLPVIALSRPAAVSLLSLKDSSDLASLEQRTKEVSNSKLAAAMGSSVGSAASASAVQTTALTVHVDLIRQEVAAFNVIGILDGSDRTLKNETIVIGAHYDHLGLGGEGSLAPREGEIHHGADDNASGVAGMLELARIFTTVRPRPRRTIIFMAYSGEEEGLLGSNYYVNNPVVPLTNTVAMINMDMIGRMQNRKLIIGGVGTAQEWRGMIGNANLLQSVTVNTNSPAAHAGSLPMVIGENGQAVVSSDASKQFAITLNDDGYGPSDHSSFYAKQVPVLFFWTGTHADYHKPSDTADKINYDDEARIVNLIARIVREIDASDKRPTYAVAKSESTGRTIGFQVYLGTIPNYADSSDGLLLDGVRDNSPAAKAGLKAGDRVVKLASRDVHNVYDYTYALGEMKAGQEYDVEVMRGSERLRLKVTPEARK